uniref:Uncharacterized protein n=1 Tax=Anguilla anguilla TaxID=7936 RepID=A0A0E9XPX3_ANGAN
MRLAGQIKPTCFFSKQELEVYLVKITHFTCIRYFHFMCLLGTKDGRLKDRRRGQTRSDKLQCDDFVIVHSLSHS